MPFIEPMLASPLKEGFTIAPDTWVAELKYDGIRVQVEIGGGPADDLFSGRRVAAWSRYENAVLLPRHIITDLQAWPDGRYDGELYSPGNRSYGTKAHVNASGLRLAIFNFLEIDGIPAWDTVYDEQRRLLAELPALEHVEVAWSTPLVSMEHMLQLRDEVWAHDGEGLILKRRAARYVPGKRSKDWIKIKKFQSAKLRIIGFEKGKGTKVDRGPYAVVMLEDLEGNRTTCKTLNDVELRAFESAVGWVSGPPIYHMHPAIGRYLWIEYQERTPSGSYRHVRWDHWDEEHV